MSQELFPGLRTIEFPHRGWTHWAGSLAAHAAFGAIAIAIPWSVHEAVEPRAERVSTLVDPVRPAPPIVHRIVRKPEVVKPVIVEKIPPPVVRQVVRFQPPPPPVRQPAPKLETKIETEAPAPSPAPAQPQLVKLETPKFTPPVRVGGFGDPNGVQPSETSSGKNLTVAKLGSFDLSEGNSRGKGSSGSRGAVAVAGFGGPGTGAGGSGPGGNGKGEVRSAGFGDQNSAPAVAHAVQRVEAQPSETPVAITFKPKPSYTPEAREKKIEGEVLLDVIFAATGQIHILRVARGLGYGLDERAREAAAQIRFQPGTRAGSPVDMKGTVHIVFELS